MSLRPLIARARRRSTIAALLVVAQLTMVAATSVEATGGSQFVSLANEKRASVGKGPVSLYAPVDQIAVERGNQMASNDELAHNLPYVASRLNQLGVCWTGVGEIIAWEKGYPTHSYQRTIDAWWASPDHHDIMIGDYNVAGGSWSVSASGATYSVMVFVKTCDPVATSLSTNPAPRVTRRSPSSGETGVGIFTRVKARFSEAVHGVSATSFKLRDAATGKLVNASVRYIASTRTAILDPAHGLRLRHWYRVTLSRGIEDRTGKQLAFTQWSFKTQRTQLFGHERSVSLAKGWHSGYRFSSRGAVRHKLTRRLKHGTTVPTSKRACIPGRSGIWYYITDGTWDGYWLRASSTVVLN